MRMASSDTSSIVNNTSARCASCGRTASADVYLKHCARCRTTQYCSRDCQKTDWKQHKKPCTETASAKDNTDSHLRPPNAGSNTSITTRITQKNLIAPINKPFHALKDERWLHYRPKADVYQLLIDTYRLRMEDDYNLTGDADFDSIYAGSSSGYRGFRRFLEQIQARNKELLPAWWSDANALECERAGRRDDWSSLKCAIDTVRAMSLNITVTAFFLCS